MKAKEGILEWFAIILVSVLDIYLLKNIVVIDKYESYNNTSSTANYIEVETIEDDKSEILENSFISIIKDTINKKISKENSIVYDGMTLDELAALLNKSLNSTISGKGYLIASYALERNVDPIMATAIILQETGCKWNCSSLVKNCNNVGGQRGYGCGGYSYFNSLDEGIKNFIDNLSNNYISYGLTTPELINPKYAESKEWAQYVNRYINEIKAQ